MYADVLVGRICYQPLFALHRNFQDWILQPSRTILPNDKLFVFAMLLTDCRDAIKNFKIIILGFYVLNTANYWMHQLNLSLVFKILIKSEGD